MKPKNHKNMIVDIQLNILYFRNRGSSENDNNIMVDRKDKENIKGKKNKITKSVCQPQQKAPSMVISTP